MLIRALEEVWLESELEVTEHSSHQKLTELAVFMKKPPDNHQEAPSLFSYTYLSFT